MTDSIQLPDLRGRPYEELVGLVVIGSSSLDHSLRILHTVTTVDGAPDIDAWDALDMNMSRTDLSKKTRAGWRVWVEGEYMRADEMRDGAEWIQTALNLLDRRDHVVHALWKEDAGLPEGLSGTYLRTKGKAPDLVGMRKLASEIRDHLDDDRLRIVWDAITRARLQG